MIIEKAEETIQKFNMLKENDRVVVAVSGGADSVALTYLFYRLKKRRHLYLHLAHLNHMIRKDQARADSLFVGKLAKRLDLPLTCEAIKVEDFARKAKLSLEDAARRVRYDFLLKVAKANSASKIALGHNQDDQAETVLMRFLRGSGFSGLRGIPPTRKMQDRLIIRPLIEIKRSEILRFLSAKTISFRTDSSNLENVYFRNRIRNKLMPFLEKDFNPNLKEMLVNFAENVSEDFDYLEKMGEDRFKAVRVNSAKPKIVLNVRKLFMLHKALQKLVTRLAIKELKGNVRRVDYRHWKELEDLAVKRPQESVVDLPGGVSVAKVGPNLVFYKRNSK